MRRATSASVSHYGSTPIGSTNTRRTNATRNRPPAEIRTTPPQPPNQQKSSSPTTPALPAPLEESMKCMTVYEEKKQIAFACYNEETNEILLEESFVYGDESQVEMIVQRFLSVSCPNLILISAKIASNDALLHLLTHRPANATGGGVVTNSSDDGGADSNGGSTDGAGAPIPYRIIKSSAYDIRQCKSLILGKLRVMTLLSNQHNNENPHPSPAPNNFQINHTPPTQRNAKAPSRYNALASILNFESTVLLRTLGSLLSFLQTSIFELEQGSTITINSIRYIQSGQFMRIDHSTFRELHIFATEHHPLIAKGQGKDKEGFSLFTLLDRTKSSMGRSCLREWMLQPLLQPKLIQERHDGIDLFCLPETKECADALLGGLSKVGAIDKILMRMQKCSCTPMDFITFSRTLSAAVSINGLLGQLKEIVRGNICNEGIDDISGITDVDRMDWTSSNNSHQSCNHPPDKYRFLFFVDKILKMCHVPVLKELHEQITCIIDEESTLEAGDSVVIHYGYHEDLDDAKSTFDNLNATLSSVGSLVLDKHPNLKELKAVFLPQVGFLLALDKRQHAHDISTNEFPDLPEDFTFVFIQGDEAFFKNEEMRQLDEEIGDLDAYIKDTESMIVSELEDDILDCEIQLRSTFRGLAELDCILSFASCACDLNFVKPEIVVTNGAATPGGNRSYQDGYEIENGRHPLQELIIDDTFIANDTNIDDTKRVNVLTGPNFSGKSCYTRQVGMLVYMAHIGSFLPCDRAKISITDQILARISSIETCAIPQSSFQLDLTQMATILRRSTPKTLVLIDEFGKGTAPVSGIAILTAALKELQRIGCKVICTTHFLEIFSLGFVQDGVDGIRALQMAVHIPDSDEGDAVPLFKLEEGVAKTSAGLLCARMAGVKSDIISRANEILSALKTGEPVKPIPANMNPNSAFQPAAKAALRLFLGVDSWNDASEEDLSNLQQRISTM